MKKLVIAIVAVALLVGAANTYVTQNLVVQQTSNLAVATATSLQTPTVTVTDNIVFPTIKACNGGPGVTTAPQGSLCIDSSTPALWQNQDGTNSWAVLGGGAAGGITLSTGTPGNIDLTATGTLDWMYSEAWGVAKSSWHGKASTGYLLSSFEYMYTGGATNTDNRAWTNFAAVTDDLNVNGIQSTGAPVAKQFNGFNGSNAVNTGWRFRLPGDGQQHTVSWQGTMFNARTTVYASLSCPGLVSPSPKTMNINCIAGNGLDYRAIVTYTAPRGCWLQVQHSVNNAPTGCINGTSCNLYVGPIWAF